MFGGILQIRYIPLPTIQKLFEEETPFVRGKSIRWVIQSIDCAMGVTHERLDAWLFDDLGFTPEFISNTLGTTTKSLENEHVVYSVFINEIRV